MTALTLLLALAWVPAQKGDVDLNKLRYVRSLPSAQRAELKKKLELLKKLPTAERERLQKNLDQLRSMKPEEIRRLHDRARKLTGADRKEYAKLASDFFTWAKQRKYLDGFPRWAFFQWLKQEKAERIADIRAMEAGVGSPRVDAFVKLYYEFRDVMRTRIEKHVARHGCSPEEEVTALGDSSPREYWRHFKRLQAACQARRARPGPIPPQRIDPKGGKDKNKKK